jgi:phospholipase C
VASTVFDHTSQLRLLASRFGLEVPNLSAWRRRSTGDLRTVFERATRPDPAVPQLRGVHDAAADSLIDDRSVLARANVRPLPEYLMRTDAAPGQARLPIRHRLP